jgi:hypothetical protein
MGMAVEVRRAGRRLSRCVLAALVAGQVGLVSGSPREDACPDALVSLITRARDAASRGSLRAASLRYSDLLSRADDLKACSVDFGLKARRECGDVFARLATASTAGGTRYREQAAARYAEYLDTYLASPPDRDPEFARVVLNAYSNMMFETRGCDGLADRLAAVAASRPSLFQPSAIDKWRKCFDAADWDAATRQARREEYCDLFSQPGLRISRGARAEYHGLCDAR